MCLSFGRLGEMKKRDGNRHVVIRRVEVGQWPIQDRAKTLQGQRVGEMLSALILVDAGRRS